MNSKCTNCDVNERATERMDICEPCWSTVCEKILFPYDLDKWAQKAA